MTQNEGASTGLRAVRRDGEQVTPLELFFDLVFVLALTQCTKLMSDHPDWTGLGRALLLLALLWWAWTGYAWLTSVVDPEEGAVRLVIFAAMAAFLVAALAIPTAFGDDAVIFAAAYAVVRVAHIALFLLASRAQPALRRSVLGLAASTALGVGLLIAGAIASGDARDALWVIALVLDMTGPYFFGAQGWQLVPRHFAERHGLIVIIALGESIVSIGVGAGLELSFEVIVGAVIGVALAAGLWWAYFDVASLVAARRLADMPPGREQNELARDAYSYLHFPMIAGIVLAAFGIKKALGHVDDPLAYVPVVALAGGVGVYLLAHVAFKRRAVGTWSAHRGIVAVVIIALIPFWHEIDALAALAGVTALVAALILYETVRFAAVRDEERHRPRAQAGGAPSALDVD
jgi:low temperature requirement protein LtrA